MIELPTRPSFDLKVCWVIALEPEARPIIDELDLRRYAHNLNFPVYFNPENGHALVISGIGPAKAAAAATCLKMLLMLSKGSVS